MISYKRGIVLLTDSSGASQRYNDHGRPQISIAATDDRNVDVFIGQNIYITYYRKKCVKFFVTTIQNERVLPGVGGHTKYTTGNEKISRYDIKHR